MRQTLLMYAAANLGIQAMADIDLTVGTTCFE